MACFATKFCPVGHSKTIHLVCFAKMLSAMSVVQSMPTSALRGTLHSDQEVLQAVQSYSRRTVRMRAEAMSLC